MLNRLILIIIFCFVSVLAKSQEWEFGGWVGAAGYMGDLNPNNPTKFTDLALGLNTRYAFNPYHALKLSFAYGNIQANDADSDFEQHRLRNLNFKTAITELAILYEFYFYPYWPGSGAYRFTPYVFTGVAGFQYEPKTEYNGTTYKLRELGTEGQGSYLGTPRTYTNRNLAIPFGVGIKYNFVSRFNIGLELGFRNTLTDYLDDVSKRYVDKAALATENGQIASNLSDRSGEVNNGTYIGTVGAQRGDPSKRDFYMFTGISLSYTLNPIRCPKF